MSLKDKSLYLIDGSAVIYRSYFAFIRNPLINTKGENTSATYGFVNSVMKIVREEKPEYLAVVFDTKEPTFRHERYPEYKSTRAKMPDDLVEQLPRIHQAVEALNIPSFQLEGYEADDVIGTIAKAAEKEGMHVWCVTGDKDYYQLVSDTVRMYKPKGAGEDAELMGPAEVEATFGVPPELVIDKLALMGDSSDNVPGVPGVGPKTADTLLKQFGSLEAVLTNPEQIKAKGARSKVSENIESARLSKELVTIKTDVPIDFSLDALKRGEVDFEACKSLFVELEFTTIVKELFPDSDAANDKTEPGHAAAYHTVETIKDLKKLVKILSGLKEIAIDTETTSINSFEAELVGVSLCGKAGEAYYVPLTHTAEGSKNLPYDEAMAELKKLLENKKVQKAGQNIKYDFEVLQRHGIEVDPISFDTMLASYVLNPSARQHSLDFLALRHFNYQMQPISELIGTGKSQKSFATVAIDKATKYAAEDADYTYRLRGVLAPQIDQQGMQNLYYNIEVPLIRVLADMEAAGVRIDREFLGNLSVEMEKKLDGIKEQIYEVAGGAFNINSTQQLSHILFEKLGLPTKGKTAKKTGYSTDVRVLEELATIHEFPQFILDYRQLTKLKSTYIDALPKLISERTGRVHTSFNQTIAATGRLSSTDPNLQNIPIRTDEGREIRRAFIPRDDDYVLIAADYSQVELRILAHYSKDTGLIEAFKKNEDIHARTAAEVFGVPIDEVDSTMRRVAKTANFAVIYGVTAYGLSQQTDMGVDEAKQFIETYFERYPGIREYMETTKEFARQNGYVETMFKRKRYVAEINDKKAPVRQFAERVAINTPIQGTAADIIKTAMLKVHKKMAGMKSKMILQVHDELVFDVHRDEAEQMTGLVRQGMEKAVKLAVPLVADIGTGENWLDCK
ncbi:DNA polymerase I [candidate division GN15 bacterium]|nr:DNA polymerase I [candidate division GN15 bacterium]